MNVAGNPLWGKSRFPCALPAENSVSVWALAAKQSVLRMAPLRARGCRSLAACPL